jgi:hypothetical protein
MVSDQSSIDTNPLSTSRGVRLIGGFMMRKQISILLASLMMVFTCTGCGSAWWQNFKTDPVAQTNSIIQSTQVVLALADVVFQQVKSNIPTDKQALVQQKYDSAVVVVTKSLTAVRDFIQTAADAKQDKPDLTKVIADLKAAVEGVQAVINEAKSLVSVPVPAPTVAGAAPIAAAPPAAPIGFDEFTAQTERLKTRLK